MNRAIPHILENGKRCILVVAATLLVMLSSCVVKASIKTWVGLPVNAEQGIPKGARHFSMNSAEKCVLLDGSETTIVQQQNSLHANDLLPVVILTVAFLFIIGFRAISKEKKHPFYSGSGKIRSAIPIFLEYRQLIIHHAC